MDLYHLGPVGWVESQSIYHALALLGREGLIICYPTTPYICLGLHDDLDYEIDQPYCRERGIPLLRREIGGGVVYLDDRQLFFQLVLRQDNPLVPLRRHRFYEKFLQPAISVYRDLGIAAELKEPADIAAGGRKFSGNGSGDIGCCVAYVGNILLDFDFVTMSRALKVPDETYRRHLYRTMRANIVTLADCLECPVEYSPLAAGLIAGFQKQLGDLSPREPDAELRETARRVGERLTSREWLGLPGRRPAGRKVKIAEGVYLLAQGSVGQGRNAILVRDGIAKEIMAGNEAMELGMKFNERGQKDAKGEDGDPR
ncbi:MAG: biotin/lipoate A/B protein ligase family protein [Deltaproteobacteria bacterium]|nr:biotin/lipoate A/B protein ligase family protein [Deltaproteobacteria bacterium]